jgi:hypothetical protein
MEACSSKKKPLKRNRRCSKFGAPNCLVSEENLDHPTFKEITMKER